MPQGISGKKFAEAIATLHKKAGHISHDIFVHGSRANASAKKYSDLDIGIRVSEEEFNALLNARLKHPKPNSAKWRTKRHAMRSGKIDSGRAGLRALHRELQAILGVRVDLSVIRAGGPFDAGPFISARKPR